MINSYPPQNQPPPPRLRGPILQGVDGGVGARTLGAALGLRPQPFPLTPCDIRVCRASVHSISLAEGITARLHGRPILAVLNDGDRLPKSAAAKLKMLTPHVLAIVHIPWVPRWREITDPYGEAMTLATLTIKETPKHLKNYKIAVDKIVSAFLTARDNHELFAIYP